MSDFNINFRIEGADKASDEVEKLTGETEKLSNAQEQSTTRVKSYKAQIKELKLELVQLGARTKENGARYDELSEKIRALDDAQEDLTIGTGQLDDQIAALPGPIGRAGAQFRTLDIALKNVKGAKVQLIKQFPILKNAIAATGIGALVILFGLLVGAVMKAFNSFKPLQQAVGRLGVAFDLVFDLLTPVIELIGTGLTVAIDTAAKSIAFLTGKMDEYNKKNAEAAQNTAFQKSLENMKFQMEVNGDAMTQLQKDLLQAEINYQEGVVALYENEELTDTERANRKTDLLRKFSRESLAANNAEKERLDKAASDERKRQTERNKLSDEQIAKIKEIQQAAVEAQIQILAARQIGTFEGVEAIKKLNEQLDFLKGISERAEGPLQRLERIIKNLGERGDEGGEILKNQLAQLRTLFITASDFSKNGEQALKDFGSFSEGILKTIRENKDKFLGEDVSALFVDVIRDYENMLFIFKQGRIENESEIISALENLEKARRTGSFKEEETAQKRLDVLREGFIKKYADQLQKADKNLDRKQAETDAKRYFQVLSENLANINKFSAGVDEVSGKIQTLNKNIQQAKRVGITDLFVIENEDLIMSSLEQFVLKQTKEYTKIENKIQDTEEALYNLGKELNVAEPTEAMLVQFNNLTKELQGFNDELEKLNNLDLNNIVDEATNLSKQIEKLEKEQLDMFPFDEYGTRARNAFVILREQIRLLEEELAEVSLVPDDKKDAKKILLLKTQIEGLRKEMEEVGKVSTFTPEQKNQLVEAKKAYEQQVKNLATLLAFFNKDLVVSTQIAERLLSNMVDRRSAVDEILQQMDTDFFGNRLEKELSALERQKQIDLELLRSKGATAGEIAKLEDFYRRRKLRLEGEANQQILDGVGQTLGLLADMFGEHTTAFKALKYMEAVITAISSGVKAFDWAWENTGPAAPVLAPLLGGLTTAKGMIMANKILQESIPQKPDYKEFGGPIYGPRHSQGGVMVNAEGGEFVINRRAMMNPFVSQMATMLNSMNENTPPQVQNQPVIKTYVLTGDMISQEKAEKRIQDLARL